MGQRQSWCNRMEGEGQKRMLPTKDGGGEGLEQVGETEQKLPVFKIELVPAQQSQRNEKFDRRIAPVRICH